MKKHFTKVGVALISGMAISATALSLSGCSATSSSGDSSSAPFKMSTTDLDGDKLISSKDIYWQQFGPGMSGNNKISYWHPTDPKQLFIAPNMGNAYVTDDGGLTYKTVVDCDARGYMDKSGERGPNGFTSVEFSYSEPEYGFATDLGTSGLFYSTDKGHSWHVQDASRDMFKGSHLACVEVDPKDDNVWYLGAGMMRNITNTYLFPSNQPHGYSVDKNSQCKLWRSDDRGKTWTMKNSGLHKNAEVESICVDPNDSNIIYLSTNYGFYKSIDRGETWTIKKIRTDIDFEVVRSIALHHDQATKKLTLFAISDVTWKPDEANKTLQNEGGGVYRSTDMGETWEQINGEGKGSLSVNLKALNHPDVVKSYVMAGGYFMQGYMEGTRTVDRPKFVKDYPELPTALMSRFSTVIVDPNNVNRLYLVNDYTNVSRNNFLPGQLWRTDDGGKTWFVTARNGQAWMKGSSNYDYWADRGNPMSNNIFLRYFKDTWTLRAFYESKSFTMAKFNCDGSILHAQMAKISLMSYDYGDTWVDIDDEYTDEENEPNSFIGAGNSNLPGHGFYQHPDLDYVVCCAGENSLWITNESTSPKRPGALAATRNHFIPSQEMSLSSYAVDPNDTNIHYATFFRQHARGEVMRSTDGGKTWSAHGVCIEPWELQEYMGDQSTHQVCFTIDPSDSQTMYLCVPGNAHTLQYVGDSSAGVGVHRSTDGGKTWQDVSAGLPATYFALSKAGNPSVSRLSLNPKEPGVLYATVGMKNGGLFRTADKGETWQEVESTKFLTEYNGAVSNAGINDIHFAQDGAIYVTVGSNDTAKDDENCGLWVSRDDMKSWTKIFDYPYANRIETARYDSDVILLSTLNNPNNGYQNVGMYLSHDGGDTWSKINAGNGQSDRVNDIAIDYHKKGRYYVSTYGSGWYFADDKGYNK